MTSRLEIQRTSSAKVSLPGATHVLPDMVNMPFETGQVIHGKYEILRLIGTGGVGFVVAARHIGFDDVVALKFLRPEYATNIEAVSRFTIEARASFKLRSEHVARVLDVDIFEEIPFIAMELLEGADLRTLLDRRHVLEVQPAIDCILQACEALAAAHAIGVIHRDIKPENLFLVGTGDELDLVKVLDFGISKVALISNGRQTHQALTRIAVGTPPYMSPEQVRASSNLDARSDLWSVGCVLYELLTGTAPFDRMSLMQSCAAVLEEEPVPPSDLRPQLPGALSDAIMRCLRKDPAARFRDVAELAEALAPFGSGRFASYANRCRAFLAGEGPGRRSTPSSLVPIARRITGSVPASASVSGVHTAQTRRSLAVRLESNVPIVRRPSLSNGIPGAHPLRPHVTGAHPQRPQSIGSAPPAPLPSPVALLEPPTSTDVDLELVDDTVPKRRSGRWLFWSGVAVTLGLLANYLLAREQTAAATLTPSVRPAAVQPAATLVTTTAEADIPIVLPVAEAIANEAPAAAQADRLDLGEAAQPAAIPQPKAITNTTLSKPRVKAHAGATAGSKPTQAYRVSDEPDVGF